MKLIHTSDLHLGKRVSEFSMLDDQRYILDQIFEIRDMSANIRQDVTVNADNRIVTLSTCVSGEKNMRYLVQGVLLNE